VGNRTKKVLGEKVFMDEIRDYGNDDDDHLANNVFSENK
jgi:hypothetical protein